MSTETYVLLGRVAEFYHKSLFKQADGLVWLKAKGIAEQALLETFRVGYAAGTLKDAIPPSGDTAETLKGLGILDEHGDERFRGCVVFPICNEHGQTTGLRGFKTDGNGKETVHAGDGVWNITGLTAGNKTILNVASTKSLLPRTNPSEKYRTRQRRIFSRGNLPPCLSTADTSSSLKPTRRGLPSGRRPFCWPCM